MAHMVRVLNLASYDSIEYFEVEIAAFLDEGWHIAESGGAGAGGGTGDGIFLNYYVIMVKKD